MYCVIVQRWFIPMANNSIPASLRLWAGPMTSSWDFPSVIRIPIFGTSVLDPDSDLKLFSRIYIRARPANTHTQTHTQFKTRCTYKYQEILVYVYLLISDPHVFNSNRSVLAVHTWCLHFRLDFFLFDIDISLFCKLHTFDLSQKSYIST